MSERPLWAPWRIEYITSPKDGQCILCDPAEDQLVDRGERCFTILNTFPYAPGHVMVAPARHVAALEDLTVEEMLEIMQLARRAVLAMRQAMGPDGFNVGANL